METKQRGVIIIGNPETQIIKTVKEMIDAHPNIVVMAQTQDPSQPEKRLESNIIVDDNLDIWFKRNEAIRNFPPSKSKFHK